MIFIKTRKTAGTTIETLLAPECGPDDIITPFSRNYEKLRFELNKTVGQNYNDATRQGNSGINSIVKGDLTGHTSLKRMRRQTGGHFDHYLKVAVHRDAASFMISLFEFLYKKSELPRFDIFVRANFDKLLVNYKIAPILELDHVVDFSNLGAGLASVPRMPKPVIEGLPEVHARKFAHRFSREDPEDVWREFGLEKELELAIKIESLLRAGRMAKAKRLLAFRRLL